MKPSMHNPAHPGEVLQEYLQGRAVTEVAAHLGVSRNSLSRLLNAKAGVSAEMSIRLGQALGTTWDFWFKMQNDHDFWIATRTKRREVKLLGDAA